MSSFLFAASLVLSAGSVAITSGYAPEQSVDGGVDIAVSDSSDDISFSTGTASLQSGSFVVQTGTSNKGRSGNIDLTAGLSRRLDGGEIRLSGGEASQRTAIGGSISVSGGNGTSTDAADGGDGGALVLTGGHSMGKAYMDSGGAVAITGGGADVGEGGDVVVSGGFSTRGSSGTLDLSSAASGTHGVSGSVSISSGKSRAGTSGAISIETGQAFEAAGGDIVLKVGDGRHRDGGNIAISAGQTSGSARTGGHVAISGGEGANAHSHDGGNGGDVELFGGEAKGEGFEDNGGEFQFISTEKTVLLLVGPSFFLLHAPDHHLLIHVLTSSLTHHVCIYIRHRRRRAPGGHCFCWVRWISHSRVRIQQDTVVWISCNWFCQLRDEWNKRVPSLGNRVV